MSKTTTHKNAWEKYLPIRRTKLRTYLVVSGVVLGLAGLARPDVAPFAVGAVFMAFAAWIHVWSKGHLDKNASLTRSGPYRWVRDPFHFSNFFMDLGLCLIINNWVFTLVFMTFWVIAYRHRLWEEDQQLEAIFDDEYRDYRARIPRMIPYRKPMDKRYDKPFSIHHGPIFRGSVCTRLFRLASYPYLMFAAAQVGAHRLELLDVSRHPLFYWALCGFLLFTFLSKSAKPLTKKRASLVPPWLLRQPAHGLFCVAMVVAMLLVERLPLDTRVLEPHLGLHGVMVVLALAAFALALASPPALWGSARFRRLLEGVAFSLLWLYTPLPWLALLPACYFSAAFLYGDPDGPEANVNRVFPAAGGQAPMPVSRYLGLALLFFLAKVPVLVG